MTPPNQMSDPRMTPGREAMVLIDQFMDEIVESQAWVEVYDPALTLTSVAGCRTPEDAVALVEDLYPLEDRDEAEDYICLGEQVWMMPDAEFQDDGTFLQRDGDTINIFEWPEVPFTEAKDWHEPYALKFWVVRVVCRL